MRQLTPKEKEQFRTMIEKHRVEQRKKRRESLKYKEDSSSKSEPIANIRKLTLEEKEQLQVVLDKHRMEQKKKRQEFLQYKADLRRSKRKSIIDVLKKPHF